MRDRCAHARATRTRAAGGEHRRGWTQSQSAPVAQPSAVLVVKTGRLRRRPSHNGKRRMPVIVWICLYSLVAVGLPHHHGVGVGGLAGGDHGGLVEDGGDGGDSGHFVCSCGYAGTSAALRLRTSWKLETALGKNMTKRRRVFGRAAEFTVFVRS